MRPDVALSASKASRSPTDRNASLYSLKWFYRANDTDLDEQEFFRYTPTIRPHKQYFPLEGIRVNVSN